VTITNGYLTAPQLKDYLGITLSDQDGNLEDAISAASRAIDSFCGRRFYADTAATARTYQPGSPYCATVHDISTTTSLAIKTDDGDDGTFETTWTSGTDYELEPGDGIGPNGQTGWPYWRIVAVGARIFPTGIRRRTLQVTAKWGWAAVPDDVEQACRLLAAEMFKRKDAPFGVAGFGADGLLVRVREDPKVKDLLLDFRRRGARGGLLVA
jgi:hypothetical protein